MSRWHDYDQAGSGTREPASTPSRSSHRRSRTPAHTHAPMYNPAFHSIYPYYTMAPPTTPAAPSRRRRTRTAATPTSTATPAPPPPATATTAATVSTATSASRRTSSRRSGQSRRSPHRPTQRTRRSSSAHATAARADEHHPTRKAAPSALRGRKSRGTRHVTWAPGV